MITGLLFAFVTLVYYNTSIISQKLNTNLLNRMDIQCTERSDCFRYDID